MGSAYRYSSLPVPDLRFGPRIEALTAIQSLLHRQKTDSGGRYVVRQLPYPVMNARHCAVKCASMIRTSCASQRSDEHSSPGMENNSRHKLGALPAGATGPEEARTGRAVAEPDGQTKL